MASPAASNSDINSLSQADSQHHATTDMVLSRSLSSGTEPEKVKANPWPLASSAPVLNTMESLLASYEHWYICIILLIIAFLHTKHHLSFRACEIVLWSLHAIFILVGWISEENCTLTTLGLCSPI
jgi:hypothetical protein